MDDVLNIIREVAEQLEDPPEIPPDAVIHDEEQINQSAQTPHQMEQFTAGASIHQPEPSPVSPPQWNFRERQDLQVQDLAVREPRAAAPAEPATNQSVPFQVATMTPREPSTSPNVEVYEPPRLAGGAAVAHLSERFQAPPAEPLQQQPVVFRAETVSPSESQAGRVAEPVLQRPVPFQVAPMTPREPSSSPNVEVYEPLRVAGAMATAQLSERFQTSPAEFGQTARIDHQAVTPEMRVSHMVPTDFPVDFQHALQAVDANISVPAMDFDTDPAVSPDYAPLEPLDSSEQVVVNASFEDDSGERNILP